MNLSLALSCFLLLDGAKAFGVAPACFARKHALARSELFGILDEISSDIYNLGGRSDEDPVARDDFEILLILIENYEAKHYAITPPDPIEAIKFRMEQAGLTPKDLEPMIGRSNRVYEILAGHRPLTLTMIRKLHAGLGIPAESLIGMRHA